MSVKNLKIKFISLLRFDFPQISSKMFNLAFSLVGVERSLFCLVGPRVRSDFCLEVRELFSRLGVLEDLPGESPALSILTWDWRQNIPKLSLHSKYFFPSTVPLFFPFGSSRITPGTES